MSTAAIDAPGAASAVDVDVSIASSSAGGSKDTLLQKEASTPVDKREFRCRHVFCSFVTLSCVRPIDGYLFAFPSRHCICNYIAPKN